MEGRKSLDNEFLSLMVAPGNDRCVDCNEASPKWISVNFGIFICLNCAGHHRSLGTHVTVVRSLELDKLQDNVKVFLRCGGNERFLNYLNFLRNPSTQASPSIPFPSSSSSPPSPLLAVIPSLSELSSSSKDLLSSKTKKYGLAEVLFYSELLRAAVEERVPKAFQESDWTPLIRSPDSSLSGKSVSEWMPDSAKNNCLICNTTFTVFNRRHHCRRCGRLVCSDCAPANNCRPILEWGFRDPVRHCKECYRSPAISWKP